MEDEGENMVVENHKWKKNNQILVHIMTHIQSRQLEVCFNKK